MDSPGERLKDARQARGFRTAKDAALAMGIAVATYTQHEAQVRALPVRRARQYAEYFRTTPEWLLYGRPLELAFNVPVLGRVGHDAEAQLDLGESETLSVPAGANSTTRALVIDTSDLGAMLRGWIALFDYTGQPPTRDLDGQLVVACINVEGFGERVYVRKIVFSKAYDGAHHLLAVAADPIMDADVKWAARVTQLIA